jgi:glycosyltransferase involved in cell wall biosynthesis
VIAYSGSTAGWQSFSLVLPVLRHYLSMGKHYKSLFLSHDEPNIRELEKEFPGQVRRAWVSHTEVPGVLQACDLGILIRDQSVTNRVASPTKFAEYLAAGLPVAISANLGDYTEFVIRHNSGFVVEGGALPPLVRNSPAEQTRLNRLAIQTCTKEACKEQYQQLLAYLN